MWPGCVATATTSADSPGPHRRTGCEPWMVAKTGLSVGEHQRRTVDNYLSLRDLAPELPFVPVVQGWEIADYLRCIDLYAARGAGLRDRSEPTRSRPAASYRGGRGGDDHPVAEDHLA